MTEPSDVTREQCAFCGGPDYRHRVVEAQMERVVAGDPIEAVAQDYDTTTNQMVASWAEAYGRALDGWADMLEQEGTGE